MKFSLGTFFTARLETFFVCLDGWFEAFIEDVLFPIFSDCRDAEGNVNVVILFFETDS